MIVRRAVENDLVYIVAGIQDFVHSSSYSSNAEVNVSHVDQTLRSLMAMPDGIVAVLETENGFGGAFVGLAHAHLFSGERVLGELFLYTAPDMRGHGKKLRDFAEQWARDHGCVAIHLAHPIGENDKRLAPLYQRWGYAPIETNYAKGLH